MTQGIPREPTDKQRSIASYYADLFNCPAVVTPQAVLNAWSAINDAAPAEHPRDEPCAHEWREMRSDIDPYRDDECKFCGVAFAEAAAQPAPLPGPQNDTVHQGGDADAHWLRVWGDDEMARGNVSNAQRFIEIADRIEKDSP
jgi:hypothetical protein